MSSSFEKVNNGWSIVILNEGLKVFGFPIMKLSFSFTNERGITILLICSVNNSELLLTINEVRS